MWPFSPRIDICRCCEFHWVMYIQVSGFPCGFHADQHLMYYKAPSGSAGPFIVGHVVDTRAGGECLTIVYLSGRPWMASYCSCCLLFASTLGYIPFNCILVACLRMPSHVSTTNEPMAVSAQKPFKRQALLDGCYTG